MGNQTFLTIIDIFGELAQLVTYLGAAFVIYMVLKQAVVKESLSKYSKLLTIIVFLISTHLLYSAVIFFINLFIFFPRRIIVGDSLLASIRCLVGLLIVAGLVSGSILVTRATTGRDEKEELNPEA